MSSSAPCTVPSSPKRPWSAMCTHWKPLLEKIFQRLLRGVEGMRVHALTL